VIKVPWHALSEEALTGVIDDFVAREGTDYGHRDYTLEEKRAAVRAAIASGRAIITFDPATGTTTVVDER
jgi:uncharacterized protein YheU (UPF0270 family)